MPSRRAAAAATRQTSPAIAERLSVVGGEMRHEKFSIIHREYCNEKTKTNKKQMDICVGCSYFRRTARQEAANLRAELRTAAAATTAMLIMMNNDENVDDEQSKRMDQRKHSSNERTAMHVQMQFEVRLAVGRAVRRAERTRQVIGHLRCCLFVFV
jgi:hypothetical protein